MKGDVKMTYQRMTNEELCTKLSAQYRTRVATACENAEKICEDISRRKAQAYAENRRKQGMAKAEKAKADKRIPGFTSAKKAAHEPSFENFVPDGKYSYAFAKAANVRAIASQSRRRDYGAQSRGYADAFTQEQGTAALKKTHKAKARLSLFGLFTYIFEKDESENIEKRVKTTPISKSLILSVILCTVMLMVVLFTYSSYTQISTDVELLKAEKQELLAEREHLQSLLAVRDDIREIEDYATNVIGMVKSDYVETRYVSVADGERIEVLSAEDSEETAGNLFSTLLSAMGGNWERVLEYID